MRRALSLVWFCLALCVTAMSAQSASIGRPDRSLGRVDFPTSGTPAAQAHFLNGVAWLHSFGY